jgi:hypothetical protein
MKRPTTTSPRTSTLAGLLLAVTLPSCGGAVGEAMRPTDHSAAGALGGAAPTCAGSPKYAKPLIVDLDPDARVDLEATMKKGVAVVAYDCQSFRVLSACKLPDSAYEYAGVQRREQVVQMNSMDDLHANMPINSAKLGAEVKSGRSIDLALVLVGRRSTTLAQVTREELVGGCDGATHFVQTATLGAFSMATGSVGKAALVAEMFDYGGAAKSESERKAMNKDGSLDECRKSSPDSETPPAECRAPLRVELLPLAGPATAAKATKAKGAGGKEEKKEAAAVENPCPEGFHFADDICTRDQGQAHLCDPKDEVECKAQCEKGSAESCFNHARLVRVKTSWAASMPFDKKACDGGFAGGCAELGRAMLREMEDADVPKQAPVILGLFNKACQMGSGRGCDYAGDMLTDKDYKQVDIAAAVKSYNRGCDLGEGMACWSLSQMYFKGKEVPQNADRGIELLSKACQGGSADECNDLADVYGKGKHGVAVDHEKAYRWNRRACDLDTSYCAWAAKSARASGKDTIAFELAQRGCNANDDEACVFLGDAYKAGRGTTADEAKAKATWAKVCKDGTGDDDACKRLGIKMKDD